MSAQTRYARRPPEPGLMPEDGVPLPVGLVEAVERVARQYGLRAEHAFSRDRRRRFSAARHHSWAVVRWTLGLSLPEIGALWGVNHTTVLAGIVKYESELQEQFQ